MKVVVVTPTGRKQFLELLYTNLLKSTFDEWHLWLNTENESDIDYCKKLQQQHNWIKIIERPNSVVPRLRCVDYTHLFWAYCQEQDTVYIRLDDDVVYLDKNFINTFANFIQNNPQYIVNFANINNNGILSYIHQRFKAFEINDQLTYRPFNNMMYGETKHIEKIHLDFIKNILENKKEKYLFHKYVIYPGRKIDVTECSERILTNAVGWLGSNFKKYDVNVPHDEELYVNYDLPVRVKMPIGVCGMALCSHYSFSLQASCMENATYLLDEYKKIMHL